MSIYANNVLFVKWFSLSAAIVSSASLNHDLELIADWSLSNGLTLNPAKFQYLLMIPLHNYLVFNPLMFSSFCSPGTPSVALILGLYVDFSFVHHVTLKCYLHLCLLYSLRHILTVSQKLDLSQ